MISSGSMRLCQKPSISHGRCPWHGETVRVAMRGVNRFAALVRYRHQRIAAEHLQALPHPSSACGSHPKPVSRGCSGSGHHPERQLILMSFAMASPLPARQRFCQGQGEGVEQARMDLRVRVLQRCPRPRVPSQAARRSGRARRGRWLCQEMALFSGESRPWPKPGLWDGGADAPQEARPAGRGR